ncbi:hypothetical protein RRG08_059257 [Elysia crispata]|uniref:Uncharacterized protein n=1 Tax=Elysia crispata TaxID=231223 RepID=A0AAE0Y9T8_9GAST|nr:hypothetical protein RRG08_059257 [Elysia crispata]
MHKLHGNVKSQGDTELGKMSPILYHAASVTAQAHHFTMTGPVSRGSSTRMLLVSQTHAIEHYNRKNCHAPCMLFQMMLPSTLECKVGQASNIRSI